MKSLSAIRTVAPAAELITLDEARDHVKRDDNDDDAVIRGLIAVVMSRLDGIDGILGRALVTQTWAESFDGFPAGACLPLALAPVIDVVSISYFDNDDQEQTFAAGNVKALNRARQGYLSLKSTASWASTYSRDDAVTVTYTAGYGTTAADVPAVIKHAGLLMLGHYYENRESVLVGVAGQELPQGVAALLRPFIRPKF